MGRTGPHTVHGQESSMITSYNPQTSRKLAEKADGSHASDQAKRAAHADFERYHSTERMIHLAGEVELLRTLVEQARRIRYSPDVGYVEVRHVFDAIRAMPPLPGQEPSSIGLSPSLSSPGNIESNRPCD
jgi:hypothetical protein